MLLRFGQILLEILQLWQRVDLFDIELLVVFHCLLGTKLMKDRLQYAEGIQIGIALVVFLIDALVAFAMIRNNLLYTQQKLLVGWVTSHINALALFVFLGDLIESANTRAKDLECHTVP